MKASYYKIEPGETRSFRGLRVCERNLGTPWHFHPEYQITVVLTGSGHRLIGDNIAELRPGDVTLLGPNLPHFWHTDEIGPPNSGETEVLMVHFREDFLGDRFFSAPELSRISRMLGQAKRGLCFPLRTGSILAPHLERLLGNSGADLIIELLCVLQILSNVRGAKPICSSGFLPELHESDRERLERMCEHVHEHFAQPIFRNELAALVGLSPRTFSRYFHRKMGKTFPQFVNEIRIGRACRLLLETDLTISEIAFQCGFENLSNFNGCFRDAKSTTPKIFRTESRRITKRAAP